ncbi:MAG: creatininase family protein [Deferribacteres bacterium]|nr:creatininase family protein [candidate division KSB1 bacterium]MCB9510511.1 creatininase family protein [Deferribacteres bacterium]
MPELIWGKYEQLRPAQIEAIRAKTPVAYLPWGALEWHSYHAPVGLDGLKAQGICDALAEQAGGVVLPAVYVGTDTIKPYKGFKHSIEHAKSTVKTLCLEFLHQLVDEQFKVIVLVTGHYGGGQLEAIEEAAAEFVKAHPEIGLWAFPDSEPIEHKFVKNHAARGETSWQLLFQPHLVDLSLLPKDRETTLDEDGVWGDDPRAATAAEGQAMLKLFLQNAVPKVQKMIQEYAS